MTDDIKLIPRFPKCPLCDSPRKKNWGSYYALTCGKKDEHHKNFINSIRGKSIKTTNLKKYGVTSTAKLDLVKLKQKNTNIKRYGSASALQNENIQRKAKETKIIKYGTEFPKQKFLKNLEYMSKNFIENNFMEDNIPNFNKLACFLNSSVDTAKNYFKKYGVNYDPDFKKYHFKNKDKLTKEYIEQNFLDQKNHIKTEEMMKFFNISESTVHRYFREFSISYKIKPGTFDIKKPAILYYIYDPRENLYKIGITNKTIEGRFGKTFCSNRAIAILEQNHFGKGIDALNHEKKILEEYSEYRCINPSWPEDLGGRTEFFIKDILQKHKERYE